MRTKILVLIGLLSLINLSFIERNSIECKGYDENVIKGIYDGFYSDEYNFLVSSDDDEEEEEIMSFRNIKESLLKTYSLKSEKFLGSKFEITYTSESIFEEDEDGDEQEFEVYTIINLKKL